MMEQEQPEANTSNSLSDLIQASVDEEQTPLGFDSERLVGEVNAGPQVSSHEQMNQELLIQFDEDKTDTRGILQPQRVSTGAEGYPEDEHHQGRGNSYLDQKSNTATDSDEQKPQSVIIDYDDGSRQKQLQYECVDTGFGAYTATSAAVVNDDDDDDDDNDDEHKNRYILDPQEFSVHVGSEADVGFVALGNRYFSQSRNNEKESQQEPPELLFELDEETNYGIDDVYMRHAEPSPPEADLDIEEEAPELQFEQDVDSPEADLATAKESNELQFEPNVDAPEGDLETAKESNALQFEPDVDAPEGDLETAKESNALQFEPDVDSPEGDLETAKESNALQFEPDVDSPEGDLETAKESNALQFEPDVAAPEGDLETAKESNALQFEPDVDSPEADLATAKESNELQFEPDVAAPEVDLATAKESNELQFEPDFAGRGSDDDSDLYIRQSQPLAPEDELETGQDSPEMQLEPDAAQGNVSDDDKNHRYIRQAQPFAPEDELEAAQDCPELQFEPEDDENQYIHQSQPSAVEADLDPQFSVQHSDKHDADEDAAADDDDDKDEGNQHVPESQRVAHDAEHDPTEIQFQPEDEKIDHYYFTQSENSAQDVDQDAAALHFEHDETVNYIDEYDDGNDEENPYASQSHDANVEEVTPKMQYQPDFAIYDASSHDNDDDDDDDGSHYTSQLHNAVQADVEEVTPELHSQPDDSIYDASSHENDYYDDDDDDQEDNFDGSRQTHQIHNVAQGNVEEEFPEYNQQQRSYYEEEYDGDDDRDIFGRRAVEADHEAILNEDNPRVLIKGILSESDEQYVENAYEEENEEEDDDTDVAIDIRDNTNVEDQFIEFEDASFVESAVGGVMDDSGLNDEKHGPLDDRVDDELRPTGEADRDGDNGGCQGEAVAKTSRVRFADEEDEHQGATGQTVAKVASTSRVRFADEEDPGDKYPHDRPPSGDANDEDYHIVPGSSNQPSYDVYDQNNTEKSLDMLLLEEICEEAASMTIKEALVHSLKPNVRAGLSTAHLKLSESEVLVLEEYCEDFVGGLIKDLLKRSSLMELSNETKQTVVKASVIKATAKHLSTMEVQQLKIYCDHFVHNVIAESIIDSNMIVARQQHQAEEIKELLQMFQNSEEMQEYFTNLTTDIVRTALLNVTEKDDLEEYSQDKKQPIGSSEYEPTDFVEQRSYPDEGLEFENEEDDFDFDSSHSFGIPLQGEGSPEYRRPRSQESWTSEDEDEMGTTVGGGRHGMTEISPGDNTFEFDEEWAEGVIGKIEPMGDGEKRQKIFMRELEFDDRANVGGTELLAPVFLAVAEDNEDDTEFEGLRRKTQSIEDLCDLIEEEKEPPRKRASSLTQPKKKPRKKPRPNSFREQMEDLKREAINESIPNTKPEEPQEEYATTSSELPSSPKTEEEHPFNAYDDDRYRWHTIRVNNREKVLDLKLIEPYMKVITHGGVHMPSRAVIVVIAACYLPDKTKKNYNFLMEQLFFYLISTLELLATTDEYFLVYFNGASTQGNQPALPWMKRFYQHIEGGLKKNMINMYIVHPNFWLKTVVRFAKAFVGTNFWSKLQFIKSLDELTTKIPVEFIYVPDEVIRCDPKYKQVHNL